jgi:hypothetical protein
MLLLLGLTPWQRLPMAGRLWTVAALINTLVFLGMPTTAATEQRAFLARVLSGAQCLETPETIIRAGAGESAVVGAGPPMVLSTVGQETRRAVLLVLHDAAQPWTTPDEGWEPRGACPP